jgi:uncharacterized protein YecE (DUF72 family)
VGVDKTFYRPAPRAEFERLAAQVPAGFRFLVKMWRGVVERDVRGAGGVADAFLDPRVAEVECVRPARWSRCRCAVMMSARWWSSGASS